MTDDRTNSGGQAATGEPALTQKNSATVRGEETLAADGGTAESYADGEAGGRPKTAASAPVYGAAGDTTDAYEGGDDQEDVRSTET
jgi:hypothetical protein